MTHHTFVVSGFVDEIGPSLDEQLELIETIGITHLDVRSLDETNVLDLTEDDVERMCDALEERDIGVTSIGSPIGKIDIDDPFEPHLERFETALDRAEAFGTEYVRIFSYYLPDDADPSDYRDEVIDRTRQKVELAEERDITLLLENEGGLYGDTPERVRDVLTTIDSPHLRAVFDPANYLLVGVTPYPDALVQVVEYVEQLHIKDATFGEDGDIVPAGEGDGEIPATLEALERRGFHGALSLEPHLVVAGAGGGYSGPDGFTRAAEALVDVLDEIDANYI